MRRAFMSIQKGFATYSEGMTLARRTLNLGILAHVDAGKTTLTERLLYAAGVIDEIGSVDDGSTQTDSLALERQRGITIKSAVVSFVIDDVTVNLIDTPGHPDFIAEVERVLSVLDGAVLVISAVEGVQAQTRVLMRALQRLRIPTLIFVNKIDRAGARLRARARGDRGATDAGDHPDGLGRSDLGTRAAGFTPYGRRRRRVHGEAGRGARRARRRRSWPRTSTTSGRPVPTAPRGARGADRAGAGASGVLRLGDHGRGRGRADGRHRGAAAGGRRRRRRPGVGHRLQDRARSGRGEDRLRPHVLGHRANARSAALRPRRRAEGDRDQRLRPRLGRAARVGRRAGEIGKLWGLGEIQIGDAIGTPRTRRRAHHFAPPTLETVVVPRDPTTKVRSTSRSPSSPSRTR